MVKTAILVDIKSTGTVSRNEEPRGCLLIADLVIGSSKHRAIDVALGAQSACLGTHIESEWCLWHFWNSININVLWQSSVWVFAPILKPLARAILYVLIVRILHGWVMHMLCHLLLPLGLHKVLLMLRHQVLLIHVNFWLRLYFMSDDLDQLSRLLIHVRKRRRAYPSIIGVTIANLMDRGSGLQATLITWVDFELGLSTSL